MTAAGWPLALAGIGQYFVAPRVLAEFAAPDPWRGGNATGWMLVLFLVSESKVGIDAAADYARRHYWKDDLPGPGRRDFAFAETVALERSDPSAEPIFLPHALSRVWQQGSCAASDIPRVLYALQPRLIASDYFFADAMHNSLRFRLGLASMAAMALLFLGLDIHFEPQGFETMHHFFLKLSSIPLFGGLAILGFRLWLVRRRTRLEAVCHALALSSTRPRPVRRVLR